MCSKLQNINIPSYQIVIVSKGVDVTRSDSIQSLRVILKSLSLVLDSVSDKP